MSIFNFTVKSSVHDYKVSFVDSFLEIIMAEFVDGDIIIIDEKVKGLYSKDLEPILNPDNHIAITATEEQKSYQGIERVIRTLIERNFRKNNQLFAIGGGIIQDVTAFISSIMYRGVDWIFLPTTLLAQGDSCIGSKTSVNFAEFKNQVGGFYPPNKIFIDLTFLDTLDVADIKSGLAEMCHYFIVSGEDDYQRYVTDYDKAISDKKTLESLVFRSLEIKKVMIEIDEFDCNQRQVFNYGHSFGHAIESLTDYHIPHGIAVAYGMDMANFVSMNLGFITKKEFERLHTFLPKLWQGFDLGTIDVDKYISALRKDKKNAGNELRLILMDGVGKTYKKAVKPNEQFTAWIKEYLETII